MFYFFGQLLGKALFDQIPVSVALNHQILWALLDEELDFSTHLDQLCKFDSSLCTSLKYFRDTDLTEHDCLHQYFVTNDFLGNEKDLLPNGADILVTNGNKELFIKLKAEHAVSKQVRSQLTQIKAGFNAVIPHEWVSMFTADELCQQLCGLQHLSLKDWKENTEYRGYFAGSFSPQVIRFWAAMETYSQQELA